MTRLRRTGRRLGTTLIVLGIAVMVYAGAVVFWRDPVTDVYTAYQQHQLAESLNHDMRQWSQRSEATFAKAPVSSTRGSLAAVRRVAQDFARQERGHDGRPLGRILIGRFGLNEVFVEGTSYWHSLTK